MTSQAAEIDTLYVAPENVRYGVPPENVDELAANIHAVGLLSPLQVYAGESGWAVVCGRRRLAALQMLYTRGEAPGGAKKFPKIEVKVVPQEQAVAISLSENTQRVDLGIVQSALAFNTMELAGQSTADIAKAFGVTERFVKGRVRLAGLHEPILEALRKSEITLDVAQAYAGAHMSRQEKVWKELGKNLQRADWRVKEALKKNTLLAGDEIARFVGEEAYVAAGGQVEHELFKTADMSRWLNPEIAERLANEKLAAARAELEKEGFAFVEAAPSVTYGAFADGNVGKKRKANATEGPRLKAIDARLKAISKEERDYYEDENGNNEDSEEREEAWGDERARLQAERNRIEAGLITFSDDAKKKTGILATIDADGQLLIKRGVVAPRDRKATPAGKSSPKSNGKAVSAKPSRPEPQAPMTNLTHEKCSRIASTIVGRALAAAPQIALVAITACAARDIFFLRSSGEALEVRGFDEGADFEGLLSDKANTTAHQKWKLAIGKDEWALEETLVKWPQEDVLALLAFCVGCAVSVVETNAARVYSKREGRGRLMTLGRLAGALPAAHFIPDADFLNGLSRESLAEAAAEMKLDTAAAKTKGALAAIVADKAKESVWTPPLIRTLCGAGAAPVAAKKPVKKAKAKSAAKPTKKTVIAKKPAKKVAGKKANGSAEARP